jgi:hypothetical protein
MRLLPIVLGLILLAFGLFCLAAGSLSHEALQRLLGEIRRPEDVTLERYVRFRHVCWFFACLLSLDGVAALLLRKRLSDLIFRRIPLHDVEPAAVRMPGQNCLTLATLVVILLVGGGLRVRLINHPLAYDEAYTWQTYASRSLPEAVGDLSTPNNHVLNTVLVHFSTRLFGPREWAIRLPVAIAGCLLLPAVLVWARRWRTDASGLIAAAILAVSPLMITYSVDARGYMFVALAAILFDGAIGRIDRFGPGSLFLWLSAGAAVLFGIWAMLLAIYPILGTSLWYVGAPLLRSGSGVGLRSASTRLGQLFLLGLACAAPALAAYASGYVFRGFHLLQHPVMFAFGTSHSTPFSTLWTDWSAAWNWWATDPLPSVLWLALLLAGLFTARDRATLLRLLAPFIATLVLSLIRRQHTPARVFLWMTPWVYLATSDGLLLIARQFHSARNDSETAAKSTASSPLAGCMFAVLFLIGGTIESIRRGPALIERSERMKYQSIPDVVSEIHRRSAPGASPNRVILPLPIDVPTLFYMDQRGIRIPHNGSPQIDETIWLVAPTDQTPEQVLADGLIHLGDWADRFEKWERIQRFPTLTLYRSRLRATAEVTR